MAIGHVLDVLIGKDARFTSSANQRANGVEHIGHREGEDGDDYQRETTGIAEQRREPFRAENRKEGGGKLGERGPDGHGVGHVGDAEGNAYEGGCDDRNQQSTANIEQRKHNGDGQTDEEQPQFRVVQRCESRRRMNRPAFGRSLGISGGEGNKTDIEHAHVHHEQTDAAADGVLQRFWNTGDDELTNRGDSDQNIDQAAQECHAQGFLPTETESRTDGVGKEGVKAHARGLSVRDVGEQTHYQRSHDGSDDGGKEYRTPWHAGGAQNLRIDDDDIAHREERSDTRRDFSRYRRVIFFEVEEPVHLALFLVYASPSQKPTGTGGRGYNANITKTVDFMKLMDRIDDTEVAATHPFARTRQTYHLS